MMIRRCVVAVERSAETRGTSTHTHTHTHSRLTDLFPGLPGWAGTRKVKPIWILLKQETVSGSGMSWAGHIFKLHLSLIGLHLASDR